jgi:hypothetical protein
LIENSLGIIQLVIAEMALFLIQHVVVIGRQDMFEMLRREENFGLRISRRHGGQLGGDRHGLQYVAPRRREITGSGAVVWGLLEIGTLTLRGASS